MSSSVSRELVAAYVDGVLDEMEAAEVRDAIARDSALRAYAEEVERANRLLREAFDVPGQEQVPDWLINRMPRRPQARPQGEVIDLKRPQQWPRSLTRVALAASLALFVGASVGAFLESQFQDVVGQIARLGPAPEDGPLHAALEHLPSGELSEAGVQSMLTFRDGASRICREFEVIGETPDGLEIGIACRSNEGLWQVEIVVTTPTTEVGPEGYRPASGPGADALDAMLDALNAQPALSPREEAKLLERGWR